MFGWFSEATMPPSIQHIELTRAKQCKFKRRFSWGSHLDSTSIALFSLHFGFQAIHHSLIDSLIPLEFVHKIVHVFTWFVFFVLSTPLMDRRCKRICSESHQSSPVNRDKLPPIERSPQTLLHSQFSFPGDSFTDIHPNQTFNIVPWKCLFFLSLFSIQKFKFSLSVSSVG